MTRQRLVRALGGRAGVDADRAGAVERDPVRVRRSTRGRASRAPPGTGATTSRRRAPGSRPRARSGPDRRARSARTPRTRWACSVERRSLEDRLGRRERRVDPRRAVAARPRRAAPRRARPCGRARGCPRRRPRRSRAGSAPGGTPRSRRARRPRSSPGVPSTERPSGCFGYSAAANSSWTMSSGVSSRMRISSRITWRSESTSSGRNAGDQTTEERMSAATSSWSSGTRT